MITYEVAGAGPDVVLLHPAVGGRRLWDDQWAWLTTTRRVVRCDFRGYGETPAATGPYSSARDVLEVLDAVGIDRAVLVGASMGGKVALDIAAACPRRVSGMVLISPALAGWSWSDEVRDFGAAEDDALERGDAERAVELNLEMWLDGHGRSAAANDPARRAALASMQRQAFELQRAAPDDYGDGDFIVPDIRDRLGEISAPTLIVVGEHDVADFHAIGASLASGLGNARMVVLPGAAHLPSYEAPEVFDPILRSALGEMTRQ